MQRSQNFNGNRGGFHGERGGGSFQNRRDQGNNAESGNFERRGGRGGKTDEHWYSYVRFLLIKADLIVVAVVVVVFEIVIIVDCN